jgi:hypothetical protein
MPTPDETESDKFNKKFGKWLNESVGISRALLDSLDKDDDWTFIIKMHGILEAALNHLILGRLHEPKLADIVSHLETNDRRTGKIAFIKAYDLLPSRACLFVRMLSEVRNRAVHDVKNFDLDLIKYLQGLNKEQRNNWKIALTSWSFSTPTQSTLDFSLTVPRNAIYNSCMTIMIRSFQAQPERMLEMYQELLSREAQKRAESTPKE